MSNCSFSVEVTSVIPGFYENNNSNFSDQNNIDSSLALATLTVIEDTSNVDIEILKTVIPEETAINSIVAYTIKATNIGSTTATNIQSGIMYGTTSQIEGMIDKIKKETNVNNYSIVLTGGFGEIISKQLQIQHILDEHLTLKGLLNIHGINSKS